MAMSAFRRYLSVVGAIGLLSIGAAGASIAQATTAAAAGGGGCASGPSGTSPGSTQVFASQFSGLFAGAVYMSVSGTTETDIFVGAGLTSTVQSGGGSTSGSVAIVTIDAFDITTGNLMVAAFGCASNPDFQIDKQLTSAALGPTSITVFDFVSNTSSTADVAVDWVGAGSPTRTVETGLFHSGDFTIVDSFIGVSREAQASGSVSDTPLNVSFIGPAVEAQLDSVKSGTIAVCVGSTCGK
jgi:hypothetical protein